MADTSSDPQDDAQKVAFLFLGVQLVARCIEASQKGSSHEISSSSTHFSFGDLPVCFC